MKWRCTPATASHFVGTEKRKARPVSGFILILAAVASLNLYSSDELTPGAMTGVIRYVVLCESAPMASPPSPRFLLSESPSPTS